MQKKSPQVKKKESKQACFNENPKMAETEFQNVRRNNKFKPYYCALIILVG